MVPAGVPVLEASAFEVVEVVEVSEASEVFVVGVFSVLGAFLLGRVYTFATHAGIAVTESCSRPRYALGVSPTTSVNRELNEPSDVQPTVMHASVTLMPLRSSVIARSIRRVMR